MREHLCYSLVPTFHVNIKVRGLCWDLVWTSHVSIKNHPTNQANIFVDIFCDHHMSTSLRLLTSVAAATGSNKKGNISCHHQILPNKVSEHLCPSWAWAMQTKRSEDISLHIERWRLYSPKHDDATTSNACKNSMCVTHAKVIQLNFKPTSYLVHIIQLDWQLFIHRFSTQSAEHQKCCTCLLLLILAYTNQNIICGVSPVL